MAWFTSCSGSDVDEALRREGWLIQISCFRYKYPANLFIERTLDRKYPPRGTPTRTSAWSPDPASPPGSPAMSQR